MRLKLDENLGLRGVESLRAAGHDVATVFEQRLSSATDARVLEVCIGEKRCLVTLDLDFANPLAFPPERTSGIAVLRVGAVASAPAIEALVATLADALARTSIEGRPWIVEPGRVREYLGAEPD